MFDPSMPRFNWQTLYRPATQSSLRFLEAQLDQRAIPHRMDGYDLQVPDGDWERASLEILPLLDY